MAELQIRSIKCKDFMLSDSVSVDLPATGLVLLTGSNGHGKSSLLEMVSHCLFNKGIRDKGGKALGWREGSGSSVTIETPSGSITRKSSATGRGSLKYDDVDGHKYATATKAQEALSKEYCNYLTWRRSFVFGSEDAARFSLSTDKERKQLLEGILGLDKFDGALKACRADLAEIRRASSADQYNVQLANEKVNGAKTRATEMRRARDSMLPDVDMSALRKEYQCVVSEYNDVAKQLKDKQETLLELDSTHSAISSKLSVIKTELVGCKAGVCQTCKQALPSTGKEHNAGKLETATAELSEELAGIVTARNGLRKDISAISLRCTQLSTKKGELTVAGKEAKRAEALLATWDEDIAVVDTEVVEHEASVSELKDTLVNTEVAMEELQVCEKVLGLKGARVRILAQALVGFEAMANVWLSKLVGPHVSVSITSLGDSIDFSVNGYAAGRGYKASSTGQRRRLDLALVFALGEVSRAVAGAKETTLWLDEVFDGLDSAGTAAAVDAIQELAEDRCVVLITHKSEILATLNPALKLHASDGNIEVV